MKKFFIFIACFLFLNLPVFAVDYSKPQNWVINSAQKTGTDFDVFYIYPTIFLSQKPALFSWEDVKDTEKVKKFSTAQTSIFSSKKVRVFAPFVRQTDFVSIMKIIENKNIDYNETMAKYGIQDTKDAFNYYLKNYNNGRPFVLMGHSQGAIDLLYSMKDIDFEDKLLAAYLIGCPNASNKNLSEQNVKTAKGKDDLGVVVIWNAQKEGAQNKYFNTPNGYVINPLNWKTDETKATRFLNTKSEIYNYLANKKITKYFLTGAKIDKKNGVLLVDLPANSEYDQNAIFGEGVFHITEVWIFSNAINKNACHRYKIYKKLNKNKPVYRNIF